MAMPTVISAFACNRPATKTNGVKSTYIPLKGNSNWQLLHVHGQRMSCFSISTKKEQLLIVKADLAREDASAVRREVLVGGAAAAGALSGVFTSHSTANAAPIEAPDLNICGASIGIAPGRQVSGTATMKFRNCCPPGLDPGRKIILFQPDKGKLRTRQPLHKAVRDTQFLEKYHEAYRLMRSLPASDPRSLTQQAHVHCVYCNNGYRPSDEGGSNPKKRLQIHFNWLFLPWHRLYLYYHEKILGSLINDPTFALPYWNWDNQYESDKANIIPGVFNEKDKWPAIYDEKRNLGNYTSVVKLDLNEAAGGSRIEANLNIMRTSVANVKSQETFFGQPYRAGSDSINGPGTLEQSPHTALHVWVGDPREELREDMGNFYSAGNDPLFYLHHSNVDRLWTVWKGLDAGNVDFSDPDYLNSEFLFYDQDKNLVKCKVKDALDLDALKYTFAPAPDSQWTGLNTPVKNTAGTKSPPKRLSGETEVKGGPLVFDVDLPLTEGFRDVILVLKGVSFPMGENRSFNVFLNFPQATEATSVNCAEFVGSWNNVPHLMASGQDMQAVLDVNFTIRRCIGDLKLSGSLTVTLVPIGENKNSAIKVSGATVKTLRV